MKKIITALFVIVSLLSLTYLYSDAKKEVPEKTFSIEELAGFDGKNGKSAYVAIDGNVYDVTIFSKWKGGKHFGGAVAGKDMSELIKKAPHGIGKLKIMKKVGTLKKK